MTRPAALPSLAVLLTLTTAGCTSPDALRDSSAPDAPKASEVPGDRSARLAGAAVDGMGDGTVEVRLAASGALVGTGNIDAHGRYLAAVDADQQHLVVTAFSPRGAWQGEVLVGTSGESGSTTTAAPINTETTVEALSFVAAQRAALRDGGEGRLPSVADVRSRIDTATARAAWTSPDRDRDIDALGTALVAAAEAESRSRAQLGADPTVSAELHALAAVDRALDSGSTSPTQADLWLARLDDDAAADQGISLFARSEAAATASLAFRATLDLLLATDAASSAVVDSAAGASAELEAQLATDLVYAAVQAEDVATDRRDQVATTNFALQTALSTAHTEQAAALAWASYETGILGAYASSDFDESALFEDLLDERGVDVVAGVALDLMDLVRTGEATDLAVAAEVAARSAEPTAVLPADMAALALELRAELRQTVGADAALGAEEVALAAVAGFRGSDHQR